MGGRKRKQKSHEKKQATPRNKNKGPMWTVQGDKVVRSRRSCPKCGPAVFMAEHYDRSHCGSCGYTLFKRQQASTVAEDRMQARRRKE